MNRFAEAFLFLSFLAGNAELKVPFLSVNYSQKAEKTFFLHNIHPLFPLKACIGSLLTVGARAGLQVGWKEAKIG